MSTLLPNGSAIRTLIKMADVINVVQEAFRMCGEGKRKMPPKTYLYLEHGDFHAMSAALPKCAAVKWVSMDPRNSISWPNSDVERGGEL
jgi:ornithine cyclodeaminase/alanine dehydrogenase-like protein (mu-crystallin family)